MPIQYTNFDPTLTTLTFVSPLLGAHTVRGFGDNNMFSAGFVEDRNSVFTGTKGESRHVTNVSKTASLKVPLQQNSGTNAFFTAVVASGVPCAVTGVDKSSKGDLFVSGSVMIATIPEMVKGKDNTVLEWAWNCLDSKIGFAGAEL